MVLTTKNGSDDFKDLLDMNFPRSNHGCGWMYSEAHAGRPLLVVTGGTKYNNPRTEFYDFTWPGASWQLGEILKEHIFSKKRSKGLLFWPNRQSIVCSKENKCNSTLFGITWKLSTLKHRE